MMYMNEAISWPEQFQARGIRLVILFHSGWVAFRLRHILGQMSHDNLPSWANCQMPPFFPHLMPKPSGPFPVGYGSTDPFHPPSLLRMMIYRQRVGTCPIKGTHEIVK